MYISCRNVTSLMDESTILFVFGDHGMTQTGDHGGDSQDELNAGLFVYSPAQITSSKYEPVNKLIYMYIIMLKLH